MHVGGNESIQNLGRNY